MCAARRPNLKRFLELGASARERGDHSAALAYFETAIAANPQHVAAKFEAARELRQMGRLEEAAALFRRVIEEAPGHVRARVSLGFVLRELSLFSEAEEVLRRAIELSPGNIHALIGLARLARRRGDRAGASDCLERAAAANTLHVGVQLEISVELRDQGQFDRARQIIDSIIQREPQGHRGWMQLGHLERRLGNHAAALAAFNHVATKHPDQVQALVEMAIEERALGQPKKSEETLKRALAVDAKSFNALMQLAEHAWLAERDQESLSYCQRAMSAHPRNLLAYLSGSRALAGLAKGEAAFALLDVAATAFGADPAIAARRADLLRQAGQWQDARAVIGVCAAEVQRHFGLWMQNVQLEVSAGEYDSAATALRDPPATSTHEMGRVCLLKGQLAEAGWRHEEAAALYREALEHNPSDYLAHSELARASLLLLDIESARQHLRASTGLHMSRKLLRGQSLNPSQSMLGQIFNEFVLDRAVLDGLVALRGAPPSERIVELSRIVRQFPENTGAAVSLLIAMRRSGLLGEPQPARHPSGAWSGVPKRLMQYWDAVVPPPYITEIMRSWRDLNPAFEYRRFDDNSAREFIAANYPADVLRAYIRAPHPAQKADLFRLAYLAVEGGFYADADDRCIAPIETIVSPEAELILYQENLGTIGNNFLGVRGRETIIRSALELAVAAVNRGDCEVIWLSTGPGLLSRAAAQILSDPAKSGSFLARMQILDRRELARAIAVNCQLSYKRTAKHWVHGPTTQVRTSTRQRVIPASIGNDPLASG
jgi:tetratricopeptide (TPR) repeat protein